jgi:hypothetical protein
MVGGGWERGIVSLLMVFVWVGLSVGGEDVRVGWLDCFAFGSQ